MANPASARLLAARNEDGGWGGAPSAPSRTETTALATLALSLDETAATIQVADAVERGLGWLRSRQSETGAWPAGDGLPPSIWMTGVAVLSLAGFEAERDRALRGARWLLDRRGRGFPLWARLLYGWFPERMGVELDPTLSGWPWTEGSFSWIEPTSYALLGLKRLRAGLPAERTASRIEEGERLLRDRSCAGGGWNYGNSRVLGETLWPYPDTTAIVLLALQDRPGLPEVGEGLTALEGMVEEARSILVLGLALLAFRLHGHPAADPVSTSLLSRLREERPAVDLRALAWAGLALAPDLGPVTVPAPPARAS